VCVCVRACVCLRSCVCVCVLTCHVSGVRSHANSRIAGSQEPQGEG